MCSGSNRGGSGVAAQLIACEIRKSVGFSLSLTNRPWVQCMCGSIMGPTRPIDGQVGPFCSQSNGLWERDQWHWPSWMLRDLKPRGWICWGHLTHWKPGQSWLSPRLLFLHALSGGSEGLEYVSKMKRSESTLGSRMRAELVERAVAGSSNTRMAGLHAHSGTMMGTVQALSLACWSGTMYTSTTFCHWSCPSCPRTLPRDFPPTLGTLEITLCV